jgi:hypothetical protein
MVCRSADYCRKNSICNIPPCTGLNEYGITASLSVFVHIRRSFCFRIERNMESPEALKATYFHPILKVFLAVLAGTYPSIYTALKEKRTRHGVECYGDEDTSQRESKFSWRSTLAD